MRTWKIIFKDLRANKLRSALTALSMFVGVVAVVGVTSAGSITKEILVSQAEQQSGRSATFQASVTLKDGIQSADFLYDDLRRRIGAQAASLVVESEQNVVMINERMHTATPVPLSYQLGEIQQIRRLPVLSGSLPVDTDVYPLRVFINQPAARELGVKVGDIVKLAESRDGQPVDFLVVAEVADGDQSLKLYTSMNASEVFPGVLRGASANILIHCAPESFVRVNEMVLAAVSYIQTEQAKVSRVDQVADIESNLALIQLIFLGCAIIALGVSALGILNIGLASVAERSRELVIRRAIGARRRSILVQMLGNAIAIGVVASFTALVGTAISISVIVPQFIPIGSAIEPPPIPWDACAYGIVAALVTAVLGSLIPALRAARLPVAHALRA